MSFSQTDLVNALRQLSDRLPEFSEQQVRTGRLLRVTTERLSSHLNENLKTFGINENLWFALMAVYVSPKSEILPSRLSDLMDLTRTSATRLSDEMVERGWVGRHINQQDRRQIVLKLTQVSLLSNKYGRRFPVRAVKLGKILPMRIIPSCKICWASC